MRDDYTSFWGHRLKWTYLLAVVAALLSPVFYVIVISFNEHGFGARIYEFTFDWYRLVFTDKVLLESLQWTGYLAVATVAVAVPMGVLAAKFYRGHPASGSVPGAYAHASFCASRHHGIRLTGLFQALKRRHRGARGQPWRRLALWLV